MTVTREHGFLDGRSIPAAWFARQRALLARIDLAVKDDPAPCRPGNCECCRGVFEIPLLDAIGLAQALRQAPSDDRVRQAAKRMNAAIERAAWVFPQLATPEHPADEFMPDAALDAQPCPLLDEAGLCRMYEARPSICRLQGHRLYDTQSGEALGDECPRLAKGKSALPFDLNAYFSEEKRLATELAAQLGLGPAELELWETTLPTAILLATDDFDLTFLRRGLEEGDE